MTIEIRKAERHKSKLRLALAGPSGAGKTMSALKLAKGIGLKTIMIDTERGSGDLYANLFDYDIITLQPPFKPEAYIEAITAAEQAGYETIIVDSLSHAWSDEGGLLDQADKLEAAGKNRFSLWADLTPQHRRLVGALLNSTAHIIATMRSKQAYELESYTDKQGNKKSKPVKLGMAPIQREGMEYEFTVFMDIDQSHNAKATKDRTNLFKDEYFTIDEKISQRIVKWLNEGKDVPPPLTDEEKEINIIKQKIVHCLKLLKAPADTAETIRESILQVTGLSNEGTLANAKEILERLEGAVKLYGGRPWAMPPVAKPAEPAIAAVEPISPTAAVAPMEEHAE